MERRNFLSGAALLGVGTTVAAAGPDLEFGEPYRLPRRGGDIQVAASNASFGARNSADLRCNGSNDEQIINLAIDMLDDVGGTVQLSEGTFNCSGPVRMKRLTTLFGRGRATELKAIGTWPSIDGLEAQGGVIEVIDQQTDKTLVGYLTVNGNQYQNTDVQGIYYNVTTQAANWGGPDAGHYFTDIYVTKTRRHGFHLSGSRLRATKVSRVRLFDIGKDDETIAHGFYLSSPDGFISQSECGGATGHGFYVDGSNLHFTNCKSWFSKLDGWHIRKGRGQFSSCEAQDNRGHGFYITVGPTSLVGCHADSNSWNATAPESAFDGFHIPFTQRVQLIGCAAYDKNESQRGNWQRYGFYLGNSSQNCQIIGVAQDNAVAASRPGTNPSNMVMISG